MTRAQKTSLTIIGLAVLIIYLPLINAPFLGWDDDYNITRNPYYFLVPWWNIWLEPYLGLFVPVANTVWYLLLKIGGGASWPFRLLNLALHLGNTCLVFLLLRGLTRRFEIKNDWAIGLGVAVFALHPLQVGAVAWISASKDLLSTFLGLSATLLFFSGGKSIRAFALFFLAVLAKPQIAALPLAMICYTFVFERNQTKDVFIRLIPWILMGVMAALITFGAQQVAFEETVPLWQRPLLMFDSFGFYILKFLWPFDLAADYGRQEPRMVMVGVGFIALGSALIAFYRRSLLAIGLLWFLLLLPVSGLITFSYQKISTVADLYNYLALAIAGAIVMILFSQFHRRSKISLEAVVIVLAVWTWLSHARTDVWTNQRNFSKDMVAQNPKSFSGLLSLGILDCVVGTDKEMGMLWLQRADEVRPNEPKAIASIMTCHAQLERYSEVLKFENRILNAEFLARLKLDDSAVSQFFMPLGVAAFKTGNQEKGFKYFCMAAQHQPGDPAIEMNIHFAVQELGGNRSCPAAVGLDELINDVMLTK